MFEELNLDAVDRDGAIREMAHEASQDTRMDFLRKSALGAGALAGGGAIQIGRASCRERVYSSV